MLNEAEVLFMQQELARLREDNERLSWELGWKSREIVRLSDAVQNLSDELDEVKTKLISWEDAEIRHMEETYRPPFDRAYEGDSIPF